jgi:DNA-directed RNA polymerase subunit RPC12/RpoP
MESCTRCGKELLWNERKLVFWNKQLKKGYITWYVIGSREMGKRKEFPELKGKKLCQACAYAVFLGPPVQSQESPAPSTQGEAPQTGADTNILDFTALNVLLKEKGVVMSAFNCPKCNNMNGIPENGKVLICRHCGSPIKPADIYEKIKALIPES